MISSAISSPHYDSIRPSGLNSTLARSFGRTAGQTRPVILALALAGRTQSARPESTWPRAIGMSSSAARAAPARRHHQDREAAALRTVRRPALDPPPLLRLPDPSPAGERMPVKLVRDQIRQRHHPERGDIPLPPPVGAVLGGREVPGAFHPATTCRYGRSSRCPGSLPSPRFWRHPRRMGRGTTSLKRDP